MSATDLQLPDTASLLVAAENAVNHAKSQIEFSTNTIDGFREGVRHYATESLDALLSSPIEISGESAKDESVEELKSTLLGFSDTMNRILDTINVSWMDVDQALGFYLIDRTGEEAKEPSELRDLAKAMSDSRRAIPETLEVISNLTRVIDGISCAFPEIEDAGAKAVGTLKRINGELDLGDAVLKRQIILAGRLLKSL